MTEPLPFNRDMDARVGEAVPVAPGVRRVLAGNPGPLTFRGTNTYLVGTDEIAVIDPGPEDEAHLEALLAAAAPGRITHILLTHAHRDHVGGLAALAAETGAITCAFPRPPARTLDGDGDRSPSGERFVTDDFAPDIALAHGARIAGRGWSLEAWHTPGHAPDHLCFALDGSGVLFSGDHVMSWNTSVVAPPEGHMGTYLASLSRLLDWRGDRLLPGHGEAVRTPHRVIKAYLVHREWREASVLTAIRDGAATIGKMVKRVYSDIDEGVAHAAALSVLAHVEHLIERGLVHAESGLRLDGLYRPA